MLISRSNYEVVFIDYFDGKLDKKRQEELFGFLRVNPDLEEEFNKYTGIHAEPDLSLRFADKEKLKKDTITLSNYKSWLIAYIENDLSVSQKSEVETFLSKNSSLKTELEILKQTKLVPDHKITFNNKSSLKRGGKVLSFNYASRRIISVAAVILIFLIAYAIIKRSDEPKSMMVQNEEKPAISIPENSNESTTEPSAELKDQPIIAKVQRKNTESSKENSKENEKQKSQPAQQNFYFAMSDPEHEENGCEDYTMPPQTTETAGTANAADITDNTDADNTDFSDKSYKGTKNQMAFDEIADSKTYREIFDKEDLKELKEIHKENLEKTRGKTSNLLEFATNELRKIGNASDISLQKNENPSENSVTYAFGIGKDFSITHKTER